MHKGKTLTLHLALWTGYVLLYATLWRAGDMSFGQSLLKELSLLPVKIILVYSCILVLVPRLLHNKNYLLFLLAMVALIIGGGLLHHAYLHFVLPPSVSGMDPAEPLLDWERLTKRTTYLNSPLLFALTLLMVHNWYREKEQNVLIKNEQLSNELQMLRQQHHPHFFFNSLNNLYSLALQKSDQTPEMILRLSGLMRYLTDHHQREWVSLAGELQFVQNYVALEELRYQDHVTIRWQIQVRDTESIQLPPLVLATYVENAFKHGVSESLAGSFVQIELTEDATWLYYKVVNNKAVDAPAAPASGIGLKNLVRRLSIIYGSAFSCQQHDLADLYTAHLKLPKNGKAA